MIKSLEDGRKEDGNRSIADKIIKRLHDLDKTVQNNQGRWAWELLQNATDSISEFSDRTVSVKLEIDESNIKFSHNGYHFIEKDIRGLINQISSKEIENGEQTKKIGRFGTGFLTTNLLSKIIQVEGILETEAKKFYKFDFPLNRAGNTTTQLVPQIENAWSELQKSITKISTYDKNNLNTSFSYNLTTDKQKKIAQIGVTEFIKLIPFSLAFNPTIEYVEINDKITNKTIIFNNNQKNNYGSIITISKIENGNETNILILSSSNGKTTIATEIVKINKNYSIRDIKNIPKIFCNFPLIGSENFHFPVVVNSFFFNPKIERDGVWLQGQDDGEVQENQQIFKNAIELYKNLLNKISNNDYFDFYNFIETKIPEVDEKYFDKEWYKNNIQKSIRNLIFNSQIVELQNNRLPKENLNKLLFPANLYSEEIKTKIWSFCYDMYPNLVCKKKHLINWCDKYWHEWKVVTYDVLVRNVSCQKNIENLSKKLNKGDKDTFVWLNSFYEFIFQNTNNLTLFENINIIPNQNKIFKKKNEIFIDDIGDIKLINILKLIGDDWKDILLNKEINFGEYNSKSKKDISNEITLKLNGPNNHKKEYIKAICLLSEWFEEHKDLGEELFPQLYGKRAELFMNTIKDKDSLYKIMRCNTDLDELSKVAQKIDDNPNLLKNINGDKELSSLLIEFNINDISELKKNLLIAQRITINNSKMDITKNVLVSLGVTSIEELEEALKDKNLASKFTHSSTPDVKMFLYVQTLIKRAKTNIIEHLKTLPNYDCTDIEELATTVIGGIKKNGLLINIVVRPSDNGEVIVYYRSEKDMLDYGNAELWIDNGNDKPRHLTLGEILKKTGINKIPV